MPGLPSCSRCPAQGTCESHIPLALPPGLPPVLSLSLLHAALQGFSADAPCLGAGAGGRGGVTEGHREKWPALRGSGRSQETPEGGAVAWVSVGFRGRGCQERPHPQPLGPGTGSRREGGRGAEGRWEVAQGSEPEEARTVEDQTAAHRLGSGRGQATAGVPGQGMASPGPQRPNLWKTSCRPLCL